jgi:hypothetical protein
MPRKAIDWNCGVLGWNAKGKPKPDRLFNRSGCAFRPYLPTNTPQERFQSIAPWNK